MTDDDLDVALAALPAEVADELAGHLETLAGLDRFYEMMKPDRDGVILMDPYRYDRAVSDLVRWLYERGLVAQGFAWPDWDQGRTLRPEHLAARPARDAVKMLTAVVRNDRFCAGALGGALEAGMVQACLGRLAVYLADERGEEPRVEL